MTLCKVVDSGRTHGFSEFVSGYF